MYKLVIVVRDDLKMSKGKTCAQVAHAVLECFMRQDDIKLTRAWLNSGAKKVVLKVNDSEELYAINDAAKKKGLITATIQDAGLTEVKPGTITCVGIGPGEEKRIDKVTSKLKPL